MTKKREKELFDCAFEIAIEENENLFKRDCQVVATFDQEGVEAVAVASLSWDVLYFYGVSDIGVQLDSSMKIIDPGDDRIETRLETARGHLINFVTMFFGISVYEQEELVEDPEEPEPTNEFELAILEYEGIDSSLYSNLQSLAVQISNNIRQSMDIVDKNALNIASNLATIDLQCFWVYFGYSDIYEYAHEFFGLARSTVSQYISIAKTFCMKVFDSGINQYEWEEGKWDEFGISKLLEIRDVMFEVETGRIDVGPEMSVRQIRSRVNEYKQSLIVDAADDADQDDEDDADVDDSMDNAGTSLPDKDAAGSKKKNEPFLTLNINKVDDVERHLSFIKRMVEDKGRCILEIRTA